MSTSSTTDRGGLPSGLHVSPPPHPAEARATRRNLLRPSLSANLSPAFLALIGLLALWILLFQASLDAVVGNSDGATVALAGQAIVHGNLNLSGWTLSYDSFWTVDAVAYALADATVGLHLALLNAVPALLALGTIVVGGTLARRGSRGAPRVLALAVLVALLALPSHAFAQFLLQGPWHVGTTLYCLGAFALILGPLRWWRYECGDALLAAALLGDLQALLLGVAPVMACGLLVAARHRSLQRGLSLFLAGPLAVGVALGVRQLALVFGTFQIENQKQTAPLSHLVSNIGYLLRYAAAMLGVGNGPYGSGGVPGALRLCYVVGLGAVLVSLVLGLGATLQGVLRRPVADTTAAEEAWRLDTLLSIAAACSIATFILLTRNSNPSYARYLTSGVIYASVLTARQGAKAFSLLHGRWRRTGATLGAVVAASYGSAFGLTLAQPRPAQPIVVLTQFLEAHHLDNGIGDYWAASIVTVDSGGAVRVRPINANLSGRLVRYERQSATSWYRGQSFDFVVYQPTLPYGRVTATTITGTFGPPAHTYVVGGYAVDVYTTPIHLSAVGFPLP